MSESGYVIMVGRERPEEVIVAHPKKDGTPKSDTTLKRYISVGKHLLPNVCMVWGRRIIEGKTSDSSVEFNTPGYKGQIEILKYGDTNGHLIQVRYLKQSRSLDVEYQDNIQKIKIDLIKGEDGSAQVELDAGENRFDLKKDALFIQYLKAHPQNRDSIAKNPNPSIKSFTFFEVTESNVRTSSIEKKEDVLDAGFIVKTLSNKPADLRVLLKIVGSREELNGVDHLSKDKQIYDALLSFSMSNPSDFMSLVANYKKTLSEAFTKADSYKVLDLTKDGHIALVVDGKPNVIWSDLTRKSKAMIDEVMEKWADSEMYKKASVFIDLVQKLKN